MNAAKGVGKQSNEQHEEDAEKPRRTVIDHKERRAKDHRIEQDQNREKQVVQRTGISVEKQYGKRRQDGDHTCKKDACRAEKVKERINGDRENGQRQDERLVPALLPYSYHFKGAKSHKDVKKYVRKLNVEHAKIKDEQQSDGNKDRRSQITLEHRPFSNLRTF